MPGEPIKVYTAEEAAEILKCKASWLREMARRRKIPFSMLSGSYRWTGAHLEEIVRLGEHRPEPEPGPRAPARRARALIPPVSRRCFATGRHGGDDR